MAVPSTGPAAQLPAAGRGTASPTTTGGAGTALASQSGGSAVATLESPLHATVIEHKDGWAHVQVDAWVKDGALGNAPAPTRITAADIRAAPDKYVGQTVEWTVQVLGIEKADDLRPELPAGQPYRRRPRPSRSLASSTSRSPATRRKHSASWSRWPRSGTRDDPCGQVAFPAQRPCSPFVRRLD